MDGYAIMGDYAVIDEIQNLDTADIDALTSRIGARYDEDPKAAFLNLHAQVRAKLC